MTRLDDIHLWLNAVWGEGRLDLIKPLFVERAEAMGIMDGLNLGPDEFLEFVPAFRTHLRDMKISILRSFEAGDWVWTLLKVEGVATALGTPVAATGQLAMRFEGDKVAEAYNSFDAISIFEQLGMLPPETVALCLSGEKFG
ncbi:nuclear transport factor 2 family protein [uncultured Thioclava sp.]|uniref:Nuclear transport factor 2 family protein n=1 Tax=Thioclava arctica TaxID=3238301 RepID=A0ABV3TPJ5_9RHOB|nr:nuclear transport factor 2 family protein [uncultured Thioclava sp.]